MPSVREITHAGKKFLSQHFTPRLSRKEIEAGGRKSFANGGKIAKKWGKYAKIDAKKGSFLPQGGPPMRKMQLVHSGIEFVSSNSNSAMDFETKLGPRSISRFGMTIKTSERVSQTNLAHLFHKEKSLSIYIRIAHVYDVYLMEIPMAHSLAERHRKTGNVHVKWRIPMHCALASLHEKRERPDKKSMIYNGICTFFPRSYILL